MQKNKTPFLRKVSALATLWLAALLCLWSGIASAGQLTTLYTYDESCNKTSQTDAQGRVTRWSYTHDDQAYDINDRLLKLTYPDNRFISYGYDLAGNITSRSTVNGTTSYEYDVMNRLAKVTDSRGGVTTCTYDAAGKRTDRTLPNGVHSHRCASI